MERGVVLMAGSKEAAVLKKTGGVCAHCGHKFDAQYRLTLSRVIAKGVGGGKDLRNLVPLCFSCSHIVGRQSEIVRKFYGWLSMDALQDVEEYVFKMGYPQLLVGSCYNDNDYVGKVLGRAYRLNGRAGLCSELTRLVGTYSSNFGMDAIHRKVYLRTGGVCAHCGKALNLWNITVEHVIPKSKGGSRDVRNLVPLCLDCNHDRGNGTVCLREFYPYLDGTDIVGLEQYVISKGHPELVDGIDVTGGNEMGSEGHVGFPVYGISNEDDGAGLNAEAFDEGFWDGDSDEGFGGQYKTEGIDGGGSGYDRRYRWWGFR